MANESGLKGMVAELLSDLQYRFRYIYEEHSLSPKFEPLFISATTLDPNLRVLVKKEYQQITARHLVALAIRMGVDPGIRKQSRNTQLDTTATSTKTKLVDIDASAFPLLYAERMEEINHGVLEDVDAVVVKSEIEEEFSLYLNLSALAMKTGSKIDPISYWTKNAEQFPHLHHLGLSLCPIPATSTESEREFSSATWLCGGRRCRLTGKQLEDEVFLACNQHLLSQ